jgi:hypothetical protein
LGIDRGKIWISPDFDAPDPELEKLFYESPIFPEDRSRKTASKRTKKKRR